MPRQFRGTLKATYEKVHGLVWLAASCLAAQGDLSVSGTVQDQAGGLVANATGLLTSAHPAGERYITHTDASGRYEVSVATPGVYTLELLAPGFVPVIKPVALSTGHRTSMPVTVLVVDPFLCARMMYASDVRLLPPSQTMGAIAVQVRLDMSRSSQTSFPQDSQMQVVLHTQWGEVSGSASVKPGGTFLFKDLAPGRYKVETAGAGLRTESWDLVVRRGFETHYVLFVHPCCDDTPGTRALNDPASFCY